MYSKKGENCIYKIQIINLLNKVNKAEADKFLKICARKPVKKAYKSFFASPIPRILLIFAVQF